MVLYPGSAQFQFRSVGLFVRLARQRMPRRSSRALSQGRRVGRVGDIISQTHPRGALVATRARGLFAIVQSTFVPRAFRPGHRKTRGARQAGRPRCFCASVSLTLSTRRPFLIGGLGGGGGERRRKRRGGKEEGGKAPSVRAPARNEIGRSQKPRAEAHAAIYFSKFSVNGDFIFI